MVAAKATENILEHQEQMGCQILVLVEVAETQTMVVQESARLPIGSKLNN
jgi:hypothetical protein